VGNICKRWFAVPGALLASLSLAAVLTAVPATAATAATSSANKTSSTSTGKRTHRTRKAAKPSHTTRHAKAVMHRSVVHVAAQRTSFGQAYGLHDTEDPLDLKSSVALVVDQDTDQVLFSKNPQAVLPIASITKLMTAVVITEAHLPMDEMLTITQDDVDTEKFSGSRLRVGTTLSRGDMLHLALMSSENRAAHALGRTYPGGLAVFVAAMNHKAQALGMTGTHYVEPTGLSSNNQSSAADLTLLVKAAYEYPNIRELSTSREAQVEVGRRHMQFHTTNGLVRNPKWDIGLQKTGYITEAGRCLVMSAQMAGRRLIMVLLDGAGKYSRIADAERIRKWITAATAADTLVPVSAESSHQ